LRFRHLKLLQKETELRGFLTLLALGGGTTGKLKGKILFARHHSAGINVRQKDILPMKKQTITRPLSISQ